MALGCFKLLPIEDTEADIASEGVEAELIPEIFLFKREG